MGWGTDSFSAFQEIIPGLGAFFAFRPDNAGEAAAAISGFISEMIVDMENVLNQMEKIARQAEKLYRKALEKLQHPAELNPLRDCMPRMGKFRPAKGGRDKFNSPPH